MLRQPSAIVAVHYDRLLGLLMREQFISWIGATATRRPGCSAEFFWLSRDC